MQNRQLILFAVAAVLFGYVIRHWTVALSEVQAQNRRAITFERADYDPQTVVRAFDPIIKPPFVTVEEADRHLVNNELVLGVEIGGAARAYPINMLTGPRREIFNDELGERRIAATW